MKHSKKYDMSLDTAAVLQEVLANKLVRICLRSPWGSGSSCQVKLVPMWLQKRWWTKACATSENKLKEEGCSNLGQRTTGLRSLKSWIGDWSDDGIGNHKPVHAEEMREKHEVGEFGKGRYHCFSRRYRQRRVNAN